MMLSYVHDSNITNNIFDSVAVGIEMRYCENNTVMGTNGVSTGNMINCAATYTDSANIITGNFGTLNIEKADNLTYMNSPNILLDDTSATPQYLGQIAVVGGKLFISKATSSKADWLQVSN